MDLYWLNHWYKWVDYHTETSREIESVWRWIDDDDDDDDNNDDGDDDDSDSDNDDGLMAMMVTMMVLMIMIMVMMIMMMTMMTMMVMMMVTMIMMMVTMMMMMMVMMMMMMMMMMTLVLTMSEWWSTVKCFELFEYVDEILCCCHSLKPLQQNFHMTLFVSKQFRKWNFHQILTLAAFGRMKGLPVNLYFDQLNIFQGGVLKINLNASCFITRTTRVKTGF